MSPRRYLPNVGSGDVLIRPVSLGCFDYFLEGLIARLLFLSGCGVLHGS